MVQRPIMTSIGMVFVPRILKKPTASVLVGGEEERNYVVNMRVELLMTTMPSTCVLELNNSSGRYTGKYTGNEAIVVKLDYTDGSTEIFHGRISSMEPSTKDNPILTITASDYAIESVDKKVTKSVTSATDIGQIASDLITQNLPGHTVSGIDTSTGIAASPTWKNASVWKCLQDLATKYSRNTYDVWCVNKDWQFRKKGSLKDTVNVVVYSQNLLGTAIKKDVKSKVNRVIMSGGTLEGLPVMASRADAADQQSFWPKEAMLFAGNTVSTDDLAAKAQDELDISISIPEKGTVRALGIPGIQRGYMVYIFDPDNGIDGYYLVSRIAHAISGRGYYSELTFYENKPIQGGLITAMASQSSQISGIGSDLLDDQGYTDTVNFTFLDDQAKYTLTNLITSESQLRLAAGIVTGMMQQKNASVFDANVKQVRVQARGKELDVCKFDVSVDNGISYQTIPLNTNTVLDSTGRRVLLRVTLNSNEDNPNPRLDSVVVEVKA